MKRSNLAAISGAALLAAIWFVQFGPASTRTISTPSNQVTLLLRNGDVVDILPRRTRNLEVPRNLERVFYFARSPEHITSDVLDMDGCPVHLRARYRIRDAEAFHRAGGLYPGIRQREAALQILSDLDQGSTDFMSRAEAALGEGLRFDGVDLLYADLESDCLSEGAGPADGRWDQPPLVPTVGELGPERLGHFSVAVIPPDGPGIRIVGLVATFWVREQVHLLECGLPASRIPTLAGEALRVVLTVDGGAFADDLGPRTLSQMRVMEPEYEAMCGVVFGVLDFRQAYLLEPVTTDYGSITPATP